MNSGGLKVGGALLSAVLLVTPSLARASDPAPDAAPAPVWVSPRAPRVEWLPQWHRFRLWEYFATAGVQAASLYIRYYKPPPAQAKWVGYNPIDDTFRGWVVADTRQDRERAGILSDRIGLVGTLVPFVIDIPTAVLIHGQIGVGWQMAMMDFQAIAVANLINNSLFYLVGRGRPSTRDCGADSGYDGLCGGTGNNASFPSGHMVTIATATGLTCVHHRHLPLFGSGVADAAACATMLLATTATAFLRVRADRHFTSDVVIGGTIGLASGYGLPVVLHYGVPRRVPADTGASVVPRAVTLVPFAGDGGAGLGLVGLM